MRVLAIICFCFCTFGLVRYFQTDCKVTQQLLDYADLVCGRQSAESVEWKRTVAGRMLNVHCTGGVTLTVSGLGK